MKTMRRILFVLAGILALCVAAWVGLMFWLGWPLGTVVAVAAALAVLLLYRFALGPRQRRWGATDDEVEGLLPGDDLLRPGAASTTRAITIDAPPERVWPWLLQIGYGRGGWYSYDWLDNDGRPSIDRIDPQLQRLAVGDQIVMAPGLGPTVQEIASNDHLLSAGDADSWCLQVRATPDGRTRLISRWRQDWPKGPATFAWATIADPGAFIMERKMLLTLRERVETSSAPV